MGGSYYLISIICFAYTVYFSFAQTNVKTEMIKQGDNCKVQAKRGDVLKIHYKGMLSDGTVFDSSLDNTEPWKFRLGVGDVVRGLDIGIKGMCLNEKRKIIVPPNLGYGDKGLDKQVPPGETIMYEVELLDLEIVDTPPNVFKMIDTNGDNKLSRNEVFVYLVEDEEDEKRGATEELINTWIDETFKAEDIDNDSFISFDEFTGPKGLNLSEDRDEL